MKLTTPRRSIKFDADDYAHHHIDFFMSTTDEGKPILEGPIIHIVALSVDFNQETGFGRGAGRTPTAMQKGNVSASGSFTLKQDSFVLFNKFWDEFDWEGRFGIKRKDRRLIDIPPFNFRLEFAPEQDGTEHNITIFNIVLGNLGLSVNSGDLELPRPLNFICADVHEDGFPYMGTIAPLS